MFSHCLIHCCSWTTTENIRTTSKRWMFNWGPKPKIHIDSKKNSTGMLQRSTKFEDFISSHEWLWYIPLQPDLVKIYLHFLTAWGAGQCNPSPPLLLQALLPSSHRPSPRADKKQCQKEDASLCASCQEGWRGSPASCPGPHVPGCEPQHQHHQETQTQEFVQFPL